MGSADPEPPRRRDRPRTAGTATEGPIAADDPPQRRGPASRARAHAIAVVDEQQDPVDADRIARLAGHVLRTLDVPSELELAVMCVDVARIAQLNRAHLGGPGPTDVLAFPIDAVGDVVAGVPGVLGDVVVCPQVAATQASAHGRTAAAELDVLVVHGILHLLGHDHADDDERRRMFELTDRLLAAFDAGRGR